MRPPVPASFQCAQAWWVGRKWPRRCTLMTASHSSADIFATVRSRRMPGVVDQRVEPAPGVDGAVATRAARGVVLGAVAGVEHRLAAGRRDLVDDGLPGLGVQLVDHHAGTLAGQLDRLAAADAAARAGDDRDLAVQKTHAGDPMRRPGDAPTRPGARTAGSPGPC